jgi:hypothetical protein
MYTDVRTFEREGAVLSPCAGPLESSTRDIDRHVNGFFTSHGLSVLVFCRDNADLLLSVNRRLFVVDATISSIHERFGNERRFTLVREGRTLAEFRYPASDIHPDARAVFMGDEEDGDFGLFIHNRLSSPTAREYVFSEKWRNPLQR